MSAHNQDTQKFKFSEIFMSFQGEGAFCGRSTAWIRLFMCNLQCDGFGQQDPTNPSTYILPYKDFDASSINSVEELPVFEQGCDSSYTWSKKFKHLMHSDTASTICDKLQETLKHPTNPKGLFEHPKTHQMHHMAFTGGEPLLKQNQQAIEEIIKEFIRRENFPHYVTVETNGTQQLTDSLNSLIAEEYNFGDTDWFWSVSPKLWSTSGELPKKAIKPEIVEQYAYVSNSGQLKFVINGSEQSWDELDHTVEMFRTIGVNWDVYVMPVGATKEEQEEEIIANIAMEAMKRGYYFSGRLHAYVFGNKIGT